MNHSRNKQFFQMGCALVSCLILNSTWADTSRSSNTRINWSNCDFDTRSTIRSRTNHKGSDPLADAIAGMLHELDECLTFGSSARRGSNSINAQTCDLLNPRSDSSCSGGSNQASANNQLKPSQPNTKLLTAKVPSLPKNQRLSEQFEKRKKTDKNLNPKRSSLESQDSEEQQNTKQIIHNTFVPHTDYDELALDDYAQSLYEAYEAESDHTLKEALRGELDQYLETDQ